MKKQYLFITISILLTLTCMISYQIIGVELAPDGTLIEPFFLIPIAYLFFFISIIATIAISITSFIQTLKK